MDWVKTTDLTNWANTLDCQSALPALVRRLIRATVHGINEMKFPAGENVQMGGWDGYMEVEQGNELVPEGLSVWEFGSSKQPSTKAEKDYAKRKANPLGVDPKQTTFVFVTPRIWENSEEWAQEKRNEGHWKDVKVLTAVSLEEWIENAPSVGFWLATTHLNKCPATDILTTEKFWEEWSFNGKERLLPSLLLSGRKQNKIELTEKFIGKGWIGVRSISQEESLAFIIASFLTDESHSDDFFSRSLIISSRDAFRSLEVSASPLILLPKFVDIGLFNSAIQRGHSVLVPLGAEDNVIQGTIINLDEIDRDGFVTSLKESGYIHAEQLSRETARNIGVLRRRLGFEGTKPRRTVSENIRALIPAVIIGRWYDSYEGDTEIISNVADVPYDDYVSALSPWMISSDPPIMKIEYYWRLTSPYDAFFYSYPYWTQQDFNRLKDAIIQVFSESDESIREKESSADILSQLRYQNTNRYSHALREGLLMTLILTAEYGANINNPTMAKPQEWVDGIIKRILQNDDQYFWKTITNHLPLIAEASPESFLIRLEEMQNDSGNTLTQVLFSKPDGYDPLFYKNYSLGMLSALESLAWEPRYLARASKVLLRLSEYKDDSNIQNKPINSLKEIFQPWHCQTFATYEEQKEVLQLLCKQNSEIAWRLLISIMPDPHGGLSFPTHRMRWRSFGQIRDKYFRNETNDMWNFVFDLLLANTDNRVDRYSDLIRISDNLGEHNREKLFAKIQQDKQHIRDNDALLWNQIRKFLHHHQAHPNAKWALKEDSLKPYLDLYDDLTPQDVLMKNLWVFDHRIEMVNPEPASERLGNNWYEKALEFRKEALKEIYNQLGLSGTLACISSINEPQYLGETLAYIISDTEIVDIVNHSYKSNEDFQFLRSFFWKLNLIRSDEEIFRILDLLNLNNLPLDVAGNIATVLKQTKDFWAYISTLDQPLIDYYWTNVHLTNWSGSDEEIIFGINRLFEYKRYSSAANYVYMLLMDSRKLPNRILANCLLGIVCENKEKFLPGSHEITTLLEKLDGSSDIEEDLMLQIQLFTVLLYHGDGYKPKRVLKALSEDVSFCIELLRWKWVHSDGIDENDKSIEQAKFKIAWEILDQFDVIPGMREDGTIDGNVLNNWVDGLRGAASEAGVLKYADGMIGDLFATYPRKAEGYPPVEICDIIEKLQSKELNEHFDVKIHNSRGVTVRGAFDGGTLEHNEADYYTRIAKKHRNTHPTVCHIFEGIVKSFLHEGARHDHQAKVDSLEY